MKNKAHFHVDFKKISFEESPSEKFQTLSKWLVFYTLLVIIWGAWVRISHSGDGCGQSWPLCHGQLIPEAQQGKTWVEYLHRLTSGFFGIFVFFLFLKARKVYEKSHPVRMWARWSLIFTITEALLGAKLVLFKLVADNDSYLRTFAMALHLLNSLALTASIFLTYDLSAGENWLKWKDLNKRFLTEDQSLNQMSFPIAIKNHFQTFFKSIWHPQKAVKFFVIIFAVLGTTGSIAALANTLFPSSSLLEGLNEDFNENSHYLIRWRLLHPLLGIMGGCSLAFLFRYLSQEILFIPDLKSKLQEGQPHSLKHQTDEFSEELSIPDYWNHLLLIKKRSAILSVGFLIAVGIGMSTLLMLSPFSMKMIHLIMAHSIWLSLVAFLRCFFYFETRKKIPVVLFDKDCLLCNRFSRYLLKHLQKTNSYEFYLGHLPSKNFEIQNHKKAEFHIHDNSEKINELNIDPEVQNETNGSLFLELPNSVIWMEETQARTEIKAIKNILRRMGPLEMGLILCLEVIPEKVSGIFYRWIAKNRYQFFGPYNDCEIKTPEDMKYIVEIDYSQNKT